MNGLLYPRSANFKALYIFLVLFLIRLKVFGDMPGQASIFPTDAFLNIAGQPFIKCR
jgi:hypothetical protein